MPAAPGFTLITASRIYGSLLGQLLSTGQIEFQAVSTTTGVPISFEVGGGGTVYSQRTPPTFLHKYPIPQ